MDITIEQARKVKNYKPTNLEKITKGIKALPDDTLISKKEKYKIGGGPRRYMAVGELKIKYSEESNSFFIESKYKSFAKDIGGITHPKGSTNSVTILGRYWMGASFTYKNTKYVIKK